MLEEEAFNAERKEFVSTTLQEFDNLDPSSLDIIFEYKAEDIMIQREDIRKGLEWQRENGAAQSVPAMKVVNRKRRA